MFKVNCNANKDQFTSFTYRYFNDKCDTLGARPNDKTVSGAGTNDPSNTSTTASYSTNTEMDKVYDITLIHLFIDTKTKNLIKIIRIPATEINLHFVYRNIKIPMISKCFIQITSMPMVIRIQ